VITQPNYLNEHGARLLARRIEAYWEARGRRVVCKVELVPNARAYHEMYVIRSNLGMWLPR